MKFALDGIKFQLSIHLQELTEINNMVEHKLNHIYWKADGRKWLLPPLWIDISTPDLSMDASLKPIKQDKPALTQSFSIIQKTQ